MSDWAVAELILVLFQSVAATSGREIEAEEIRKRLRGSGLFVFKRGERRLAFYFAEADG